VVAGRLTPTGAVARLSGDQRVDLGGDGVGSRSGEKNGRGEGEDLPFALNQVNLSRTIPIQRPQLNPGVDGISFTVHPSAQVSTPFADHPGLAQRRRVLDASSRYLGSARTTGERLRR